jgi:hypothetical protein
MPEEGPGKGSKHVAIPPKRIKTNVDTAVPVLFLFDDLLCVCHKLYFSVNYSTVVYVFVAVTALLRLPSNDRSNTHIDRLMKRICDIRR